MNLGRNVRAAHQPVTLQHVSHPCPHCPGCSTTAGKRGKGKKSGGRADKPLVVITELPYQTNKVRSFAHVGQPWLAEWMDSVTKLQAK